MYRNICTVCLNVVEIYILNFDCVEFFYSKFILISFKLPIIRCLFNRLLFIMEMATRILVSAKYIDFESLINYVIKLKFWIKLEI